MGDVFDKLETIILCCNVSNRFYVKNLFCFLIHECNSLIHLLLDENVENSFPKNTISV